ncbi:hypothetical protein JCM8097_000821 [Rhodosporidiobolus ruineniae]
MPHSLLVLDDYQGAAQKYDWASLRDLPITFLRDPIPTDKLVETLKPHSILHANRERTKLDRATLEQLPNLKLIATTGGRNRGIDIKAAKELGIVVSGTSREGGSLSTGTVEQTWALILALSRRILPEHESVRNGGWQTGVAFGLAGRTLGLVGVGNLGTAVAQVAKAFGMRVRGWSPNLTQERADKAGVELASSLDDLLDSADVVSIHIVSSESTRGLLGARELARLGPSSFLVNTSRGPIVDEGALLEALRNRTIAGAGLDVYDEEPLPKDHPIRKLDNVVLSPHMGYVEDTTYDAWWPQSIENIRSFLEGKPLRVLN